MGWLCAHHVFLTAFSFLFLFLFCSAPDEVKRPAVEVFTSTGWVEGLCKQLSGKRVFGRSHAVKQQLWLLAFRKSRSDGFIWNPVGNSSLLRLWYLWMEFNKRNSLSIEALEHCQTAPTMRCLSKENWTDHPPIFSPPLSISLFIFICAFNLVCEFLFFLSISSPNSLGSWSFKNKKTKHLGLKE